MVLFFAAFGHKPGATPHAVEQSVDLAQIEDDRSPHAHLGKVRPYTVVEHFGRDAAIESRRLGIDPAWRQRQSRSSHDRLPIRFSRKTRTSRCEAREARHSASGGVEVVRAKQ